MPIRASVESLPEPGYAILRISDLDAAPDGLAISIQRQQGPDSHLADDGWRRTEAWLLPEKVERKRDVMEFHLGPEICDRLAGIATVRLRVQEPDIGVVATTVIAWPTMLTSGAVDPSSRLYDDTVRLRRAAAPPPAPEPAPEPEPEPELPPPLPPPRPELRASRALDPGPPRRSGAAGWLIAALVLVAIAGGGYYAYTTYFQEAADTGRRRGAERDARRRSRTRAEYRRRPEIGARDGRRISRHQAHARGDAGQGARLRQGGRHGRRLPGVPPRRRNRQSGGPARTRDLLRSR